MYQVWVKFLFPRKSGKPTYYWSSLVTSLNVFGTLLTFGNKLWACFLAFRESPSVCYLLLPRTPHITGKRMSWALLKWCKREAESSQICEPFYSDTFHRVLKLGCAWVVGVQGVEPRSSATVTLCAHCFPALTRPLVLLGLCTAARKSGSERKSFNFK